MQSNKQTIAPLNAEAQKLYDAIRAKGYAPHGNSLVPDLRDAAHEAHHALYCNLRKPWTRNNIHDALVRRANKMGMLANGELAAYELNARAVEWRVCEWFGIAYDVKAWAEIMWWETAKNMRIQLPEVDWIVKRITERKDKEYLTKHVDAVLGLVPGGNISTLPPELKPEEKALVEGTVKLCAQCGRPRKGHKYRHTFKAAP